jgi:arylsulfatase A-like enzyme/6-phosphogluconolactonase (cycloisomerase 2 family)
MKSCIASLTVLLSLAAVDRAGAAGERPNVLFIAVDDLRPELNCYGASHIKSPNLDKLAARGTLFNRAYCQQAVCSPSRTSLLTGLRPDSTRVYDLQTHFRWLLPDVVALPQHFKNHGYHSEGMGKIYHGGLDDAASWSVPHWTPQRPAAAARNRAAARTPEELEQQARQQQRQRRTAQRGPAWASPDVADNELADGKLADHAVERLRELSKQEKPFFLAVGFLKPHLPFIAPRRYFDLYDPNKIKLADNPYHPKGSNQYTLTNSGELRAYDGMPKEGPISEADALKLKHAYYACVSYLDANVGRVLDELEQLKLRENTIVVLWGDHGWKLGEHGEWCKHSNVENDTRVPLLISAPGLPAGQKSNSLAEFVDIYPTLCDLAGLPKPSHLEGASLEPVLRDPAKMVKNAAFSQYPRGRVMGYSIRTDRYRLTRWIDRDDPEKVLAIELYDHQTDPAENENVANNPANAAVVKELTERLQAGWRGAVLAKGETAQPAQLAAAQSASSAEHYVLYVSVGGGDAVAVYKLDPQTGLLERSGQVQVGKGPGAQTSDAGRRNLYVSVRGEKSVATLAIDPATGGLSLRGTTPTVSDAVYLAPDKSGRWLLTSYYAANKAAVYPIKPDGTIGGEATSVLDTDKNPHSIQADGANKLVYVPNTGADKVLRYRFDVQSGKLTPADDLTIVVQSGLGPRHFWFHPNRPLVYFVNEKGSSVSGFRIEPSGAATHVQTISTLPEGYQGNNTCAHIETTPDGKLLYASNRGHDSLAIYKVDPETGKLTAAGHQPTEKTPRSFTIDPSGRYVYSAGQGSNKLAAYRIDPATGKLATLATYDVGPGPSWVQVVRLPAER